MRRASRTALIYYLVLSSYALWVLALPTFPTQDGPMHLYYAHVFQKLLSGTPEFDQYFFIKHILPPQSVHLYLLVLLSGLVSPEWSEKIMALLCILIIAGGVRFLMSSLQRRESVLSIFAIPLTLAWPLFEGLFGFVLGLGIALFGVGIWCRVVECASQRLRLIFYALAILLPLVHPVALLFLVTFCCLELVSRALREQKVPIHSSFAQDWAGIGMLLVMCLYVLAFFKPSTQRLFTDESQHSAKVADILSAQFVSPLQGPISIILRFALMILALFAIRCACFGIVRRIKTRCLGPSDVLLGCSLVLALLIPFIPFELNGAAFISQRMIYVIWIGLLCSAEANLEVRESQRRGVAIVGAVFGFFTLFLVHIAVIDVARIVSKVPSIHATGSRGTGILIAQPNTAFIRSLAFDPFSLSGAKAYLKEDVSLLNGPWLRSPSGLLGTRYPVLSDEDKTHPILLPEFLGTSPGLRGDVLSRIDFIVIEGQNVSSDSQEKILRTFTSPTDWECRESGYYAVCELRGR